MIGSAKLKEINGPLAGHQFEDNGTFYLLDKLPVGVYVCTSKGAVISFNQKAISLWGYKPDRNNKALKFCGFKKIRAGNKPLMYSGQMPMSLVIETGKSYYNNEIYAERHDGTYLNLALTIEPLMDLEGNIWGAINTFQEIPQENVVKELIVVKENYHHLIDLARVAIYSCDALGYINYYNKAAVELWGREPEAGKHLWCGFSKIYHPDGTPMPLDQGPMARTLKEGVAIVGNEIIIEREDGIRLNILPHPVPIFDKKGKLSGAINTLLDITDYKKEEQRRERLASIADSSTDAVISKTLDGIITSWNYAAQNMFGYSEKEMIGKPISTLIPSHLLQEEKEIIRRIIKGEQVDHYETERKAKDGTIIPISFTISPVKNHNGQVIGASKIVRDISYQIEIQNKLKKYSQQLEQLKSHKDDFIGMASHELKTPLTSIKANLQLLQSRMADSSNSNFINKAVQQVGKLSTLISDLLDVSKMEAGKLQLNHTTFNINSLILECIESMEQGTSHSLIYNECKEEVMILGDRLRIEQVIINILSNAVKYSPLADKIIIECYNKDGSIVVCIKDFGIGIAQSQWDKIFSRFYRVEGPKSTFSGLGIGLYISHDIIDRHKGKMWVISEEGKGSSFYFSLPLNKSKKR